MTSFLGPALRIVVSPEARVPVVPWDERFTSVVAQQALIEGDVPRKDRRALVDKVAAILILQNYLDYRKVADEPPLRGG